MVLRRKGRPPRRRPPFWSSVPGSESRRTPWVTIPDPGPGGSRLRAALQSCQERSRILRGDPMSRHDQDQFRNFLGHELRSPLTAIKTALAVLAADKGRGPDRRECWRSPGAT